jgi:hypothetical protein
VLTEFGDCPLTIDEPCLFQGGEYGVASRPGAQCLGTDVQHDRLMGAGTRLFPQPGIELQRPLAGA